MFGHQGDIDYSDLVVTAIKIQSSNCLSVVLDDQEIRIGELILVERVLGLELHTQEVLFGFFGPRYYRHLIGACARV
jgi:hypothetical protein